MTIARVTFPLDELGCASSSAPLIESALGRVPGVMRVYVNPATEMAYVEYDPQRCGLHQLTSAIKLAGFRTDESSIIPAAR